MMALRVFVSRLWGSLTRKRRDTGLSEEVQTHLALLAEEFERRGMTSAEAYRAARREFGNIDVVKEEARDQRAFPLLQSTVQDARFAGRQFKRTPSFSIAVVLTLALGIGATTAVFSVLDLVALRPLSYPSPERLVTLQEALPTFGPFPVSAFDARFWRQHATSFETLALATANEYALTGQGEPERILTGVVQADFLPLIGGRAAMGRLFLPEEETPGRDLHVVLSDGLWRRRFNADPTIVGRSVLLGGVSHEVVGVLAPDFRPPNLKHLASLPIRDMNAQMWKPLAFTDEQFTPLGGYNYVAIARLQPGVSADQARQELAAAHAALVHDFAAKADLRTVLTPMQEQMASRSRAALSLLLAAVVTVLLVGCVNVVNLLLARTVARRREMSIREAVGAGPGRIVRQLLVESLLLSAIGGVGGIAVAYASLQAIIALAPGDVPRLSEAALDLRLLSSIGMVSALCGLAVGIAPAWQSRGRDLQAALKGRGDADTHRATRRLRSVLVATEIGLSAAALTVAALLLQGFVQLLAVETGFSTAHLLTLDLNLSGERYRTAADRSRFIDATIARLERAPGVSRVAAASQLPLTGTGSLSALSVEGTSDSPYSRPQADVRSVTPTYFRALSLPLSSGRAFEAADRERNVAVLSTELAAKAWPHEDPIGRRFRIGLNANTPLYEVVGVVGDVRSLALDKPITPTAYVPFPQRLYGPMSLVVESPLDETLLAPAVRDAVRGADAELPIGQFRSMDDVRNGSLAQRRFQLQLVAVFALLAALLASVGVYGVIAYSVVQRTSEIGVRLALGARPRTVVGMILKDAAALALLGLAVALPLALSARPLLATFLTGVGEQRPGAFGMAAALVVATALSAAVIPAVRASRISPLTALRSE